MTPSDFDEPRMIYTGPLPPHLQRAREAPEERPWFEPPETAERSSPVLAISAAAAVALVTGIAIGAFAPMLLHRGQVVAQAPVAPPAPPVVQAAAEPAAPPAEELTTPAVAQAPLVQAAAAPAPRAAVAVLTTPHAAAAREKTERPCGGSAADRVVCADPVVASADRDLKRAYQHAQAAGAPAATLHSDQIDWLLFRDDAAKRSPADLALAYRQRIDQLNSLAEDPPH